MTTKYYIQKANFKLLNKILDRNFGVIQEFTNERKFIEKYSICNQPLKQ